LGICWKVPIGDVIVVPLSVNLMIEFSGNFGSLESRTLHVATATPPVVAICVNWSFSWPPGMMGLTLSSSHGIGAGVAELHSTPMKYVALPDPSLLTSSVVLVPFQSPVNGPGLDRSMEVVGCGGAVLGSGVGAGVLVGVGAAEAVGALVDAAAVTPVVGLPPHADASATVTGSATSALKRLMMVMVPLEAKAAG
jgi:hypothetical protein